eukprot:760089-Alexandrium_andersonii.AAC.1
MEHRRPSCRSRSFHHHCHWQRRRACRAMRGPLCSRGTCPARPPACPASRRPAHQCQQCQGRR